ncbi:dTDP-4-amino-4,6-dideoxygalactose transaminase [Alpinimonas psychrophila]|uniref:dTDP-4-amino-4,6-dideoxygalactose transaminase n=1 Tax=Alpinimonas psychrophila TaxID=748908 RepID=A0A7W3JU90_9MICO|nr:dTDP-4-amino-4,6-dideoxygalactose transaminase [Alpinimonas psychrophila]MBA8829285.1 dTDP-4-amino-4,6-dideoxygalactose transaminase [Alpinimonas psychrophila]
MAVGGDVNEPILFSRPFRSPLEKANLAAVIDSDHVHGDGSFTASASAKIAALSDVEHVLLTTSGTHALEMAVRLLDVGAGDEVIVPSFTFTSGANSIVATGGVPVFVDIEGNTGNIDPSLVEAAITPKTKAISVMHYGGVPVDMPAILDIARRHGLTVIEDNAHGLGVKTPFGTLGSVGDIAIQSFHDTKNVHSGEGGAVLISNPKLRERAEIMREKGTNRSKFLRGQVDKYSWVDWGSSYLPSELNAAVLDSQLDSFDAIQARRHEIWNAYQEGLGEWAASAEVSLMTPPGGIHAAHVFFMVMPSEVARDAALTHTRAHGVVSTFHYVPLHTSAAGQKFGRTAGSLAKTDAFSGRLLRLPLWTGMSEAQVTKVIDTMKRFPFPTH